MTFEVAKFTYPEIKVQWLFIHLFDFRGGEIDKSSIVSIHLFEFLGGQYTYPISLEKAISDLSTAISDQPHKSFEHRINRINTNKNHLNIG